MNIETDLEPIDLLAMQRDQIRMNVRKAEHARLNKITHAKAEDRMVACASYGLIETNEVVTVRLDTAKVVGRRAMTKDERSNLMQQPLRFEDVRDKLSDDPGDFDYDDEGEGNELPPEA